MAKLAIKGDLKKGKEIINLFRNFGATNPSKLTGCYNDCNYYIDDSNYIALDVIKEEKDFIIFTIDDFYNTYPFKIGDKVIYQNTPTTILSITWDDKENVVKYILEKFKTNTYVKDLSYISYDENINNKVNDESINIIKEAFIDMNDHCYNNIDKIKLTLSNNFEISHHDTDFGQIIFIRKKIDYPKNYIDCCKVLNIPSNCSLKLKHLFNECEYLNKQIKELEDFRKLLICYHAYCKIDNWEPNYNKNEEKYALCICKNTITDVVTTFTSNILTFKTPESLNEFINNFNDLINKCKMYL